MHKEPRSPEEGKRTKQGSVKLQSHRTHQKLHPLHQHSNPYNQGVQQTGRLLQYLKKEEGKKWSKWLPTSEIQKRTKDR